MKRIFLLILVSVAFAVSSFAHGSGKIHVAEMYSVLPFKANENGQPVAANKAIGSWLKIITSELIDGYKGTPCEEFDGLCFYEYLGERFNVHCKHRLLFHWGFNARPWNDALEKKISKSSWRNRPDSVALFKQALIKEQARRNARANEQTEKVFGYASGGTEAGWANGILSIVYDVHLLGDYVLTDNRDFEGVTLPSAVAGDIVSALRRIDKVRCADLVKEISATVRDNRDEHTLADKLITLLQKRLPSFLLSAQDGSLKRRWISQGYILR